MVYADFQTFVSELFANGKVEVGLEVGQEVGLAREKYIGVPNSFKRAYYVRVYPAVLDAAPAGLFSHIPNYQFQDGWAQPKKLADKKDAEGKTVPAAAPPVLKPREIIPVAYRWQYTQSAPTTDDPANVPRGWGRVSADNERAALLLHEGALFITQDADNARRKSWLKGDACARVFEYWQAPVTKDGLKNFYRLNVDRVRQAGMSQAQVDWVISCRLWSVISGAAFPVVPGDREVTHVPDSPEAVPGAEEWIDNLSKTAPDAFTALVARGTSWKKTNHAVGGTIASGFPQRYLMKMGWWDPAGTTTDKDRADHRRNMTTAFYDATHAASVHFILAAAAPSDTHHYSFFDGRWGCIVQLEVKESARLRLTPRDQVAGAAIVVDAITVAKMVVKDGFGPLLINGGQMESLADAATTIGEGQLALGMRGAVYANWFFSHHPDHVKGQAFSQKDSTFFPLACELAVIATTYYKSSTIGKSMALVNAAAQGSEENIVTNWRALAAQRNRLAGDVFLDAAATLNASVATGDVAGLMSADAAEKTRAIRAVNALNKHYGDQLDLDKVPQIRDPNAPAATSITVPDESSTGVAATSTTTAPIIPSTPTQTALGTLPASGE
jgi:hypothetical protein